MPPSPSDSNLAISNFARARKEAQDVLLVMVNASLHLALVFNASAPHLPCMAGTKTRGRRQRLGVFQPSTCA
ncbi:hypothetical protein V5799_016923 [Amblyomma americanum]|uniref:Uncharacterized protein n=1 Tax=Amblyomma americanum TaxID=6943 RepID=A0AAQ4F4X6_AMBAM